jgi:MoaA/NifB/PqqE/SkfB family radical SAM enzyme
MNSDVMRDLRMNLLDGQRLDMCKSCHFEDQNKKVNGRQRQLLKSGISLNNFDKTLCASPHFDLFEHSYNNQGHSDKVPIDLQIDLGNTCNSACVMCYPIYSSRLATDYVRLNKIDPDIFKLMTMERNWTDNEAVVDRFIEELKQIPDIKYLHFLGGETLYLKSFYDICNRLIDAGLSKNISFGTTTNCTVWNDNIEPILASFDHVHLGMSIEALHPINDYVRWPSKIDQVLGNVDKFLKLREKTNLHLSLRITPNALTLLHIDTIFEFMIENSIIAESCNILRDPLCLRMEVLPKEIMQIVVDKVDRVIKKYNLSDDPVKVVNRRRPDLIDPIIAEIIFEYQRFFKNCMSMEDDSERYNLVKFLKGFEQLRGNRILDYLPEYEEFLRSYGY